MAVVHRRRHVPTVQRFALVAAITAVLPYSILKLLWLGGSTVGLSSTAGAEEMVGARHVIGNALTLGMVAVAIVFMGFLTRQRALRIPGAVVFVLGAGAAGLLAPILFGLPVGLLVEAIVVGSVRPADQDMAPWVFGAVYTGFCVLAVALAVVVGAYVVHRWGHLLTTPPPAPSRWVVAIGAIGMLPFSCAMAYWAVAGPGEAGPQGMEQLSQRAVLLATAVVALAGLIAPLVPRLCRLMPRTAWLLTWTGCCVAAIQGPTQILLAQGGVAEPLVVAIAVAATPGASVYGVAVLRRHLRNAVPNRSRT